MKAPSWPTRITVKMANKIRKSVTCIAVLQASSHKPAAGTPVENKQASDRSLCNIIPLAYQQVSLRFELLLPEILFIHFRNSNSFLIICQKNERITCASIKVTVLKH